jgi:hypothetical protein
LKDLIQPDDDDGQTVHDRFSLVFYLFIFFTTGAQSLATVATFRFFFILCYPLVIRLLVPKVPLHKLGWAPYTPTHIIVSSSSSVYFSSFFFPPRYESGPARYSPRDKMTDGFFFFFFLVGFTPTAPRYTIVSFKKNEKNASSSRYYEETATIGQFSFPS